MAFRHRRFPQKNWDQQQQQGGAAQYGQPPPGTAALPPQPSEVTSLSSGYDSPDSPLLDK